MRTFLALLLCLTCGCACCSTGQGKPGYGYIEIKSAKFGANGKFVDVTEQCRRMIAHDELVLPKNLYAAFDVDPVPGVMKYVELDMTIDGHPVHMSVADNLQQVPLRLSAAK